MQPTNPSALQLLAALRSGQTPGMMRAKEARDSAANNLRGAVSQRPSRRLAERGQSALDVLGIGPEGRQSQTDTQNRVLLEMGLGMMGGSRGERPGAQFSRGIRSGLDLLDEIRGGDRQRDIDEATVDYDLAAADLERETDMMAAQLGAGRKPHYGMSRMIRDEEGDEFFVTQVSMGPGRSEPVYAPIGHDKEVPVGEVQQLGSQGRTSQERVDEESRIRFATAQAANNAASAQAAYEQFNVTREGLRAIDDALRALEDGANTGFIDQFLPTVRAASQALENARRRMGLNVVGATTFGALSKGELDLALSINIPEAMEEKELKEFLVKKRNAQIKLMEELQRAAAFFEGGPGVKASDYIEMLRERGEFEGPDSEASEDIRSIIDSIKANRDD